MINGPEIQQQFDMMIGRLDRILSEMVDEGRAVKVTGYLDKYNVQTLKHHAEDMILAGRKILTDLGYIDHEMLGLPKPAPDPDKYHPLQNT